MMKLTLLLCLGFLACANASVVSHDVEIAAYGITDTVNKAISEVKQAAKQALEKAKVIAQDLKEKAVSTSQKVLDRVKSIVEKVNIDVGKLIAEAKKRKVNIIECVKLEIINNDGLDIVSRASNCLSQKMEQGDKYIEAVRSKSDNILNELGGIREETEKCRENAESIKDTIDAYKCINKATRDVSVAAGKKVPNLVQEIGKLTLHLASLPATVPLCTFKSVISDYSVEAQRQAAEIKQCIRAKIESQ